MPGYVFVPHVGISLAASFIAAEGAWRQHNEIDVKTGGITVPPPALHVNGLATPDPFEAKAVCEASTETPNQRVLFQS